ncbi:uncharacterized protein Pyn_40088 [Prunus yedoensis var. nudiflora]|uniref:Agglutinin domain-containing protein n=1 Tax=Prunus yedoensis var. nudiflora TaxID=2094558 RepID=A0A314Y9F7_PRUYE|nr:uncharacterized protein Pyn_40088 [Prunus yedoensis var. nudiflora]
MPTLPRFVVVTSNTNGKYLRYIDEDIKNEVPAGYLKFSGQEAGSQYAKFEVEKAKSSGNEGLVHIKCCYNNKYWVRRTLTSSSYLIAAVADEPVEDKTNESCTLFEPVYINDDYLVGDDESTNHILMLRFRHTRRGEFLKIYNGGSNPAHFGGLYIGDRNPNPQFDVFTVTDWESLFMMLPKDVAFKGHNGNLLGTRLNEVFTSADGGLSFSSGKLWRLTKGDWICLDADNSTSIKRFAVTEKITSNDSEAYQEVKELGVSKEIYNVNFRLKDAMIYTKKVVEIVIGEAVNRTEETQTVELKLSYKKTRSGSLKSSVFKLGVQRSIDGEVPVIADNGKIEVDEFAESVERRKTGTATIFTCSVNEVAVYKVVLTAMAMVKVRLLATKASYDVPFSYTQRETLTGGQIITNDMDDGVYCGTNTFNFKLETTEEKL